MDNQELYHYGVLGMKWGVRRARRKEAKNNYKRATDKAFAKYEKDISNIEKGYKRGQNLSKKDQTREAKAEADYKRAIEKAKSDYKKAKSDPNKDYSAKQRLRDQALYGKGGEKRINKKLNQGHGLQGARHYEVERKERKEKIQRNVKKGAKKTARVLSKIGSAYVADQVFFGGQGTQAVKTAVKYTGRAVVSAYIKARGGWDIHWYDN